MFACMHRQNQAQFASNPHCQQSSCRNKERIKHKDMQRWFSNRTRSGRVALLCWIIAVTTSWAKKSKRFKQTINWRLQLTNLSSAAWTMNRCRSGNRISRSSCKPASECSDEGGLSKWREASMQWMNQERIWRRLTLLMKARLILHSNFDWMVVVRVKQRIRKAKLLSANQASRIESRLNWSKEASNGWTDLNIMHDCQSCWFR